MSESEGSDASSGSSGSGSGSSPAGRGAQGECPVGERWLAGALAQHHGAEVRLRQTDVRPGCGAGQAALSDILAVHVRYSLGDEGSGNDDGNLRSLRLVVKLPPRDPFSRYFVAEAQFDLREIKFYTEVVPDLNGVQCTVKDDPVVLPVPKCYHAHYGRGDDNEGNDKPESALILEDIRPLGYRTANFSDGLTLKQAEAAMDAVARVHALSLVYSSRSTTPLASRYPFLFQSERASDSYQQLLERGLPQLARFLQDRPSLSSVQASLEALRPKTRRLIEALLRPAPPMAVITHTDFWCNNLMFRERDGEHDCCILDWQMVTLSRPTNDLALLLVSSVSGDLRRKNEKSLLDHYFARVSSACRLLGEDIAELGWSKANLRKEYRRSSLLALLLCLGSVDVALGDEKAEKRLEEALQDAKDQGLLAEDFIEEQLA